MTAVIEDRQPSAVQEDPAESAKALASAIRSAAIDTTTEDQAEAAIDSVLDGVDDPVQRIRVLGIVVTDATEEVEARRPVRDAAMLSALLDYGAKPVHCYKRGKINRNAFARLSKKAKKEDAAPEGSVRTVARKRYRSLDIALATVEENGPAIIAAKALAAAARKRRDAAIHPLAHGEVRKPDGTIWMDTEIGAIAQLTSQRVAQIKNGRR